MRQVRTAFFAALLLGGAPLLAQQSGAQTIEDTADLLSDCPPVDTTIRNRDGSLPDVACTRQWVAGTVVRRDIQMSFAVGSAELTAAARATLDRFAARLKQIGYFRPFTVEGHTDSSGGRAVNKALSEARAASVVDYLVGRGVDRAKLKARGLGYDQPLPGRPASDPANRRVEIEAH